MRSAIPLLVFLLLGGCLSPSGPDDRTNAHTEGSQVGVIAGLVEGDPFVDAPDSVRSGAAFEVTVATFGGGCTRADTIHVDVEGLRATLTPYNLDVGRACADDLVRLEHTADLRFHDTGTARILVRGREFVLHRNGTFRYEPMVVERRVVVH